MEKKGIGRLLVTEEYSEYVKLDNRFYYQLLTEVCNFLIIVIFFILPMLVCIMYFYSINRKKTSPYYKRLLARKNIYTKKVNLRNKTNGELTFSTYMKAYRRTPYLVIFIYLDLSVCT